MTIDASGEYPTAHFAVRDHAPVEPVGYSLSVDLRGAAIELRAACVGSNDGISEDDVMTIFARTRGTVSRMPDRTGHRSSGQIMGYRRRARVWVFRGPGVCGT